ncbi:hypothetical protein BKA58DRAFT_441646 [Alternaria rosae]|uniref:uncharacterized protein n=1 Tax=Alternaria rosae TaxID=1187941 RepID=UPI001E8E01AA|nr:uncharacterized protein BKA58DRAFT_441646 [Alternaria rosae]KAH6866648.1 hypothetical protein BKA58DRAFT_441646 [Alternaria rosae]
MSGAYQQQHASLPIIDEFRGLLESQWTREVACHNECGSDKSCRCQRKVVHVHALEAWWKKQASESPKYTNLQRFVHDMPLLPRRSLPVRSTKIDGAGQSCLRVFSLLVRQGREHFIDCFYEANMYDHYIDRNENYQRLHEQLSGVARPEEVDAIIEDFHKEKWEYCPLTLTLDMDTNLQGTKVIPPFCLKIRLPDKGGTASIYWVAIQRDLVSDSALAFALKDSLYIDNIYGECYQMVLKSYCGNKKQDFEMEKEAFSGLQSNVQAPILRCLGAYTHDHGEGKELGKTYNLLLEYGENDLYQAWADETNVPPVQAQEILQSWNSLFEVASAIRHLHNLEFPRGKGQTWKFHGWHADIKPDNILSVRGHLKLADFGFSSFAPVVEGHDGSEQTELIRGYTNTYGAPEVTRMEQPDGTLSGVSQSIDAWSFGCVLSLAATWTVLGFQGIRQYERLRRLSSANNMNGLALDRFHDGYDVLPEIGKWHNYLRGHLRASDTTTELVLDLTESKLLRGDAAARCNLGELCKKLRELSGYAEFKIKGLEKVSKDTDPAVMKALSSIENEAQLQISSEPRANLLQQPLLQVNPRERASMQINKKSLIKNKPLGQTAHRKEILEKKLEACYGIKLDDEPPLAEGNHNGAVTHSPTESTFSKELEITVRKIKPRNPQLRTDQGHADTDPQIPNGTHTYTTSKHPATPPPSCRRQNKTSGHGIGHYEEEAFTSYPPGNPVDIGSHASSNLGRPTLQILTPESPSAKYSARFTQPKGALNQLSASADREYMMHDSDIMAGMAGKEVYTTKSPSRTPIHVGIVGDAEIKNVPFMRDSMNRQVYQEKSSVMFDTSPTSPSFDDRQVDESNVGASSFTQAVGNSRPSIIVSRTGDTQLSQYESAAPNSTTHVSDKQALYIPTSPTFHDGSLLPLPQSALILPYDICLKRKGMDAQVSKGIAKSIAKVKGKFGFETRMRDASLAETFSDPRELVIVVDNGWTMYRHWPIATFVAQTLAMNAAGLDKDGFDLKFTVDGHTHNKRCLKGDSGRRRLKRALKAAWPEQKPNSNATTDMAKVFRNILKEWDHVGQPATTLLVLTDGVWSKENTDIFNKIILDIARLDQRKGGNRHFSIQFIRFGDEAPEKGRLEWLDDHLCADNNMRDIIDHCSWRAEVDKMFTGSIEVYADNHNFVDPPMLYDYDDLVGLFNTFNKGVDALLSPTGNPSQTPSRASNRSSFSSHVGSLADART